MQSTLLALVLFGALACELAIARSHSNSFAWRQFKQQHGKVYPSQEEDGRRFAIFMANKQLIESHNADSSRSFTMELNHMADWTRGEKSLLNGYKMTDSQLEVISDEELAEIVARDAPVPDEIDWRKVKDRVTDVKDQGHCAACWAFATTGLLEGQELPQNMTSLVSLSAQEILDCAKDGFGCFGGSMASALFDLGSDLGGIQSESDYPYSAINGQCRLDGNKFVPLKIDDYKLLPRNDEVTLKQVVATYGPVATALDAQDSFMHYASGIFDDNKCSSVIPNHAVLVVGYGTDAQKGDYWILKNSWGSKWGEEGYVRVKRGANLCGIANLGTLATFWK